MNNVLNLGGSAGLSLGVLAAGLLLAYGVWVGRRDLGMRGAWGVLGAALVSSLLPASLLLGSSRLGTGGGSLLPLLVLTGTLSVFLAFFPLYVAVNWLEVIRGASRLEVGDTPA